MPRTATETLGYVAFFVQRPQYISVLLRKLYSRVAHHRRYRNSKAERCAATQWAATRSIDTDAALHILTGRDCRPLTELFPAEMRQAVTAETECPVKMGGPGNVDLIYHLCEAVSAVRAVETGVAYGYSSLAILLSLAHREDSLLISIDMPYPGLNNDEFVGCVVPDPLKRNWQLLRLHDRRGLPVALTELGSVDVAHYDSDKSYEGRMWSYRKIWPALREGGYLISDDIGDNLGFRDFVNQVGRQAVVVHLPTHGQAVKYIGVVRK